MKTKSQTKILIIEDEAALLYALNAKLSLKGYQVKIASNYEQGLDKIVNLEPDVVIVDAFIGNKSSLEMIEKIKLDQKLKNIPIALITDTDTSKDIKTFEEIGINLKINKTKFTLEEMVEIFDEMIEKVI